MPTQLKVAVVVNVVSAVALAVTAVFAFAGGGFVSGVFPEPGAHELVLVPVSPEEARRLQRVPDLKTADPQPQRRAGVADVAPQHQTNDPSPGPWVAMPDGSVRFERHD